MTYIRFAAGFISSFFALVLTLPILAIGIPLWFVSIIQKNVYAVLRRMKPATTNWDALLQYHPVIGWKPKPNMNTYAKDRNGNSYKLTTDEFGWRNGVNGTAESEIIIFGDSYAFGFGVNDDEFFANVIPKPRMKAIGANGYNLVQEFILMEEYATLLKNKTVIWFIYHGNDLHENLMPNLRHYRMPFIREGNGHNEWEIVTNHVDPTKWPIHTDRDYLQALADICSDTALSRRAFAACNFLIKSAKEICERQNANLMIFSLPDVFQIDDDKKADLAGMSSEKNTFDPDLPDRELKRICDLHSVPFYTMKNYLSLDHFIKNDGHWNKEGNRKVAELIRDIYTKGQ